MLVGLTGGIGAGKSLISKILEILAYPVFNSDLEARYLAENNSEIKSKIIEFLGEKAYQNGVYQRAVVANIVFNNKEKITGLNEIIHPAVRLAFQEFVKKHPSKLVFNEAALLFETGAYKKFDKTILVFADEAIRKERILKRDKTNVDEINARLSNQWTDNKKRTLADFEIDNNGNKSILLQIHGILKKLK